MDGGIEMKIVKDVMTKNPACCTPDMGLVETAVLMLKNDCGEIPVVYSLRDKKVLGVITDRDMVTRAIAMGLNPLAMHVEQIMSHPPVVVKDSLPLEDCCKVMEDYQVRRLPVVDENENCCGIIALADIVKYQTEELSAEVVKKISLPHDSSLTH
jgi:CBS domain-containing protein